MSGASVWKEGGDSRAELHVAGGALIGGLGGGSAFSTIGGAAGAGLTSKMAGTLNDISKGVASAAGSDLIGNLAANIAAGVGGAAVGGTAGAAMASNVHLYNQSVDDERALTGDPARKTTSLFSLSMQGIANGLSAIVGMGGGVPPTASPGVVLAEGAINAARLGVPGYVPDNATLSKGSDNSTPSPVLSDDPYNPSNVDSRAKPTYQTNPAHDTSSPLYNPKKTPEPADAQSAYKDSAVRGGMGTWYAQGETGYYQYFSDNAGTVHFSGTIPASKVPASVLKILGK